MIDNVKKKKPRRVEAGLEVVRREENRVGNHR
jgi:hypothetical protein